MQYSSFRFLKKAHSFLKTQKVPQLVTIFSLGGKQRVENIRDPLFSITYQIVFDHAQGEKK